MKNLLVLAFFLFTLSSVAFSASLESGDYGVQVRDRSGNIHHCTLNIQNNIAQKYLVLNIPDCPPEVTDVYLHEYESGNIYVSNKINDYGSRGGTKFYEIHPKSSTQFEMITFREFGNGEIGKPRSVLATKK